MSVLIVTKKSQLEYYQDCIKYNVEKAVRASQEDYDFMLACHDKHYSTLDGIEDVLSKNQVPFEMVLRENLTQEHFKDRSAVVVVGGDGTYFGTACFIHDKLPVLGIRASPDSEGGHMKLSFDDYLPRFEDFVAGKYRTSEKVRIEGKVMGNGSKADVATNDLYLGDMLSTGYFRHRIEYGSMWTKRQGASGVLVSTYDGQEGWYNNNYNLPQEARFSSEDKENLRFRLVSPKRMGTYEPEVRFGIIRPGEVLRVQSYMIETGWASFDGAKRLHPRGRAFEFNRGSITEVRHSDHPLSVVEFD